MALLQMARLLRHGAITQVTLGPVQVGASICAGKIRQRHDPQELSTALQSASASHARFTASGMPGMLGSERMGSGGFGAAASSSAGAFMPDAPDGVEGEPTCVMAGDGAVVGDPSSGVDLGSVCSDDGASSPGSLES
jgi:hypothetical protein